MPAPNHLAAFASSLNALNFSSPVAYVYNPLDYARATAADFHRRYATGTGKILLLGMNPGPWGMAQTGVPFGEVNMVRDWLGIKGKISKPANEHPKRPVMGLDCHRSEVSGKRVWGWARDTFETPDRFFEHFFVANYCPLMFLDADARNITPDKLPAKERTALESLCDQNLLALITQLKPRRIIGIGKYAESRARAAIAAALEQSASIEHSEPTHSGVARPRVNVIAQSNPSPLRKQRDELNRNRKGAATVNQNHDGEGASAFIQDKDSTGMTVCHCSVSSAEPPRSTVSKTPKQSPLRKQRDELNRDRKGAATQLKENETSFDIPISSIPHPSPANPAANRGWAKMIDEQLLPLVSSTNA